jgi:hypothetical protein
MKSKGKGIPDFLLGLLLRSEGGVGFLWDADIHLSHYTALYILNCTYLNYHNHLSMHNTLNVKMLVVLFREALCLSLLRRIYFLNIKLPTQMT